MNIPDSPRVPLALKISLTIFLIILVPIYWRYYGPQNFLWLSDIGLLLTLLALWLESPLCISMAAIGILPLELVWNVDFFGQLLLGHTLIDLSSYMFNPIYPHYLRALSLFHIFMPTIWIWYLIKWGYHKKAFICFVPVFWCTFIVTYLCTSPKENINWVFMPIKYNWHGLPTIVWLIILLTGLPLIIFWPMHKLLSYLFRYKKF